jgi:hypothetical protein
MRELINENSSSLSVAMNIAIPAASGQTTYNTWGCNIEMMSCRVLLLMAPTLVPYAGGKPERRNWKLQTGTKT